MTPLLLIAGLAMEGPRTTAFAARCRELQQDTPALTCERVARTRAAGHPVEIWETIDPGQGGDGELPIATTSIFIAIETHAGWWLSEPVAFETGRENGHHNAGHDDVLEGIEPHRAHRRALIVVRAHTESWCSPGVCDVTRTSEVADTAVSCGIGDDGVPTCEDAATPSRSAPRTR